MSADKEHKEHVDLFSLKVRQKLEDHRLPVDTECWEQIEAKVAGRPRPSVWRMGGWITAVAAVLALLLVIRLYQPQHQPVPALDAGSQGSGRIAEKKDVEKVKAEKELPDGDSAFAIPRRAREQVVAVTSIDTVVWEDYTGDTADVELPSGVTVSQPATKTPVPRHRGPEPDRRRTNNLLIVMADKPKAMGGKWQIGANMGTGGHLSLNLLDKMDNNPSQGGVDNDPDPGQPQPPIDIKPDWDMDRTPESFTNVDCAPPLSFGFTIRKNLNNRIALESGLVYTYLYSKMYENAFVSHRATLGLHYLGIPVHLVVKLWDHPNWSVYVSGGFMMEKGLRSLYHVEAYGLDESKSATYRSGIDGLQWSLNLSVGVSYRFYRDWSLYLEPRYSYYFDNNQPVSYRTENTTLIGVGAGIRFEF